jgi:phage terminase small subunit
MDAIEVRKADFAAARAITPELILHEWRQIAFADPTELIRTVVYGCRHCWGIGYEYEWTPWEYRNALHAALRHRCNKKCETDCNHRIPPDGTGGLGYRRDRAPNPDCPACQGEGIEDVRVADMRRVSPAARRLIAGVKKTKDGVEIKTRDQSEALKNLAQWVGLLIERKEVNVTQVTATLSPDDLTDEQLLAYIRTEMRQKEPLTLEATNG